MILDLGLPGKDGLEVLRDLRAGSQIPVIILTARDDTSDRVAGLEAGADDYIGKPFHFEELFARVRARLRGDAPVRGPARHLRPAASPSTCAPLDGADATSS